MRHLKVLILALAALCQPAFAELTIEITEGVENPVPVAVVPFAWQGDGPMPEDVMEVVGNDLARTGQFEVLPPSDMLSMPDAVEDIHYRDWRTLGVDYVLVGQVDREAGEYEVTFGLVDVYQGSAVEQGTVRSSSLRRAAHYLSNRVYEQLTGVKGAFATQLLYVTVEQGEGGSKLYRLQLADADGYDPRTLVRSSEPLLSPAWGPEGEKVAYVSYQRHRPVIYGQNLSTGRQRKLADFEGINGAPAWSPSGERLAFVSSKDGNSEVYVMRMADNSLQRVTNHWAIDTEPAWGPEGESLIFTSDRSGKPQIYRTAVGSGETQRLTFQGDYNARGALSPDGRYLFMVHGQGSDFHIAKKDLEENVFDIITDTELDESPSVAPNSTMLIYATQHGGRGVLAVVSADGRAQARLPYSRGDVREPAWSPYLQ